MGKPKKPRQDAGANAGTPAPAEGAGASEQDGGEPESIEAGAPSSSEGEDSTTNAAPSDPEPAAPDPDAEGDAQPQPPETACIVTVGAEPSVEEVESALQAAEPDTEPAAEPARDRYRPTHRTLSAEIAHLSREAFRAKDFAAHGELHQVEMAIAHLRQTMTVAKARLKGEPRELLEQLLEGL